MAEGSTTRRKVALACSYSGDSEFYVTLYPEEVVRHPVVKRKAFLPPAKGTEEIARPLNPSRLLDEDLEIFRNMLADKIAAVKAQINPHLGFLRDWKAWNDGDVHHPKDQCRRITRNLVYLAECLEEEVVPGNDVEIDDTNTEVTRRAKDIYYCAFGLEGLANIVNAKVNTFYRVLFPDKEQILSDLEFARKCARKSIKWLTVSFWWKDFKDAWEVYNEPFRVKPTQKEQKTARQEGIEALRADIHKSGISEDEMFPSGKTTLGSRALAAHKDYLCRLCTD